MVVERWQLCRDRKNDNGRCSATKRISQSNAADGRGATYARPGISACGVYLGPEPSGVAQSELIASVQVNTFIRQVISDGRWIKPKRKRMTRQTNLARTADPRPHEFGRYLKESEKGIAARASAVSNYESIGDS